MKKIRIFLLSIMLLVGLTTFAIADNNSENLGNSNNDLACTQEVKLCSDGIHYVARTGPNCQFAPCPNENEINETIVGGSCGTVTPGTNNECCENKGYDKWDAEEFACIKNLEEHEIVCEEWSCTHWTDCINGTQTRKCTWVTNCTNNNKTEEAIPKTSKGCFERERIREHYNHTFECPENCTCTGSTVKCEFGDGRTMTVYSGKSGNVIIQIKGVNTSTNVTLYKEDGKIYGNFTGNKTKEIHLPDEVVDKLKERHQKRLQLYNESINLTDEGYYQVQTKKKARLFWLIPVRENMRAQVDAETGEIIKIRNPWWGFLARDNRE
jgi:hypothetical protein